MSRNATIANRTMRNKFGSASTNESSQVPTDQQLHTYTDQEAREMGWEEERFR